MAEYLKQKEVIETPTETTEGFNHDEHMAKVQRIASQIIELAKQLKGEEEIEEEAENSGTLFEKVMKKVK